MLNEGITLMAAGMGTVFLFLIILWFAVSTMGKIVMKLNEIFPEQIQQASGASKQISEDLGAVIAIAIAKMKNR